MTRRQLVHGLRALHEQDQINEIRTMRKTGHVLVNYTTQPKVDPQSIRQGQLIITNPL